MSQLLLLKLNGYLIYFKFSNFMKVKAMLQILPNKEGNTFTEIAVRISKINGTCFINKK